jgi:hypothetical protein
MEWEERADQPLGDFFSHLLKTGLDIGDVDVLAPGFLAFSAGLSGHIWSGWVVVDVGCRLYGKNS